MSCTVRTNKHGNLSLRLFWQGREWQERVTNRGKPAKDVPANRKRIEARAVLINEEMEAETFEYLRWFPQGNRADEFKPKDSLSAEPSRKPSKHFMKSGSKKRNRRLYGWVCNAIINRISKPPFLPFMDDLDLNGVTLDTLESFRIELVEGRAFKLKTARNIIDGSLRAMFRDAGRRIDRNPFKDIP